MVRFSDSGLTNYCRSDDLTKFCEGNVALASAVSPLWVLVSPFDCHSLSFKNLSRSHLSFRRGQVFLPVGQTEPHVSANHSFQRRVRAPRLRRACFPPAEKPGRSGILRLGRDSHQAVCGESFRAYSFQANRSRSCIPASEDRGIAESASAAGVDAEDGIHGEVQQESDLLATPRKSRLNPLAFRNVSNDGRETDGSYVRSAHEECREFNGKP
jgi:hypothetical protein